MSDILLIITFFANVVSQIFLSLDTVKYEGISILDIFCAIIFMNIMVWFIQRMINRPYEDNEEKGIWRIKSRKEKE